MCVRNLGPYVTPYCTSVRYRVILHAEVARTVNNGAITIIVDCDQSQIVGRRNRMYRINTSSMPPFPVTHGAYEYIVRAKSFASLRLCASEQKIYVWLISFICFVRLVSLPVRPSV